MEWLELSERFAWMAGVAIGLAGLKIGHARARRRQHSIDDSPSPQRTAVVDTPLSRDEAISRVRERIGHRYDLVDESPRGLLLSTEPTRFSYGFLFWVTVEPSGDGCRVTVGTRSRYLQFGPVVTRAHRDCVRYLESAFAEPGRSAGSSASPAAVACLVALISLHSCGGEPELYDASTKEATPAPEAVPASVARRVADRLGIEVEALEFRHYEQVEELDLADVSRGDIDRFGLGWIRLFPSLERLSLDLTYEYDEAFDAAALGMTLVTHAPRPVKLVPLGDHRTLTHVSLRFNATHDLAPLSRTPGLRSLEISTNAPVDFASLADAVDLTSLTFAFHLEHDFIEDGEVDALTDLTAIAGLRQLRRLDLSRHGLLEDADLAPLARMSGLRELVLPSSLSAAAIASVADALPACEVSIGSP